MAVFLRELVLEHPLRVLAAIPVMAVRGMFRRSVRMQGMTSRWMVRIGRIGIHHDEFVARASQSGREQSTARGASPEGLRALKDHVAAGDTVVVTTGTERHVAEAFLRGAGAPDLLLIGSLHDGSGRYLHNFASRKVTAAREAGVSLEGALFYTDATADIPLARIAARTRLVDPDAHTAAAFARAVARCEIVRWRVHA
jgi:phosphatidylglycerophosphatase C